MIVEDFDQGHMDLAMDQLRKKLLDVRGETTSSILNKLTGISALSVLLMKCKFALGWPH